MGAQFPERIGRYRTTRVLGKGGFGIVISADDDDLGGSVAIKILGAAWSSDADIRKRFVDEARLLRTVRSDYLITVHDIGELEDGRPYFVMDLADRGSLADRLNGQRGVDAVSLKAVVTALKEALSSLHGSGFVHRDVTPKNLLIRRMGPVLSVADRNAHTVVRAGLIGSDERLILGDLGLAKDVVTSTEATVIAGTPQFRAPEQMRAGAEIGEATDVYGATAVIWNVITGEPPPEIHLLENALETLGSEWQSIMRKGLAPEPVDRFVDIQDWYVSANTAIVGGVDYIQSDSTARYRADLCPYQGLEAFQPSDADRFFGRDQLVVDLVSRLRDRHVMVVAGASGSGKSSLVRAGLIPGIQSGALPGSERWPTALFTPGSEPIKELEYQMHKVLSGLQIQGNSIPSDVSDENYWRLMAERITDLTGGALICIDQFEELFTFDHNKAVVQKMLNALISMVGHVESKIRLVLVVRADFYGSLSRYPWLAQSINENQVLVGPMSRIELREVIVTPAKYANLKLDDGLVDAILDEGGAAAGALPLVSHALAETWKRRSGKRLTIENYRSTGGVAGAIGQSAEILFNERLKPLEQAAARRLVLRLVSPGEGVPDTRRPIAVADLQGDADPKVMRRVMAALVEARLLTIDRNSIQLAHEAIITSWPRLRDWINESRDDLRVQQRIERAAADWLEADRDPDLFYHGTPLSTAREWQIEHGQDLNMLEREFLDEAENLEHIAQSQTQAAAQRVRTNRRLAFTSLTLLTIAALVLSVIAFTAFHRARSNEKSANQRLSQSLASQAVELVNQNPRLALALAAEVIERTANSPVEARIALVNATTALASAPYAPASTPKVVGDALTVAVHPIEEIIVTGNRDGTIELWTALGQPIGAPTKAHSGAVEEIVFSPNGSKMLSAGLDGKVMAWDFSGASLKADPTELVDLKTILWSVAITPDVSKMATASEDGTIRLFDLNNAMEIEVMVDLSRDFISVQFSPDGKLLFAGNGRGEVWSWYVSSGEQLLAPFLAHQSDAWEIVFHPAEPIFATASSDGRVRVWDLESGSLIAEPFAGIAANVRGVQIDANGLLTAGDENGKLQFWQSDTRTYLGASAAHHDSQVIDASLQHTGSLFVSLGLDHVLRTWRRSSGGLNRQIAYHDEGAYGLAVSADARRLATGDGSGHVRVFDSKTAEIIGLPLTLSPHRIWALALDKTGKFVAAGDQKGTIAMWEVDSGRLIARRMQAHEGSITSISFHPSKNILVSAGSDGIVTQWNSTTLESMPKRMSGHQGGVTRLAFSPDGDSLAITDRAGWIRIWDFANVAIQQEWAADDNTIWSIAWSPDGKQLATAHADEAVTLWDVKGSTPVNIMTPHPGGATDVVFLADGMSIASASRDGTVRLWDRALGVHIGTAMGRPGATQWRLASGQSANWFVSTRSDGAVEFWDLLDMETVCRRAVWDTDAQRRYLGEGEEPLACVTDK